MARMLSPLWAEVSLAAGASSLSSTIAQWGAVDAWLDHELGVVPELDLHVWADTTFSVTAAELFGGTVRPVTGLSALTFTTAAAVKASLGLSTKTTNVDTVVQAKVAGRAGDLITIAFVADAGAGAGSIAETATTSTIHFKDAVTTVTQIEALIATSTLIEVKTPGTGAHVAHVTVDEFTATALAGGVDGDELPHTTHGLLTGDGPFQLTTTGMLPTGLPLVTDVWVIKTDANHFKVATSLANAMKLVDLTFTGGTGSGTHTITPDTGVQRVRWHSLGLLGPASDGAISLTNVRSYQTRKTHSPQTLAYALVATFTGSISASIFPTADRG